MKLGQDCYILTTARASAGVCLFRGGTRPGIGSALHDPWRGAADCAAPAVPAPAVPAPTPPAPTPPAPAAKVPVGIATVKASIAPKIARLILHLIVGSRSAIPYNWPTSRHRARSYFLGHNTCVKYAGGCSMTEHRSPALVRRSV